MTPSLSFSLAGSESDEDHFWKPVDRGIEQSTFSIANRELREWLLSEQIQAWVICYYDLLSIDELSDEEKSLEHYDTEFYRDRDYWVIRFRRREIPEGPESYLVQGITYWVLKLSMKISRRVFEYSEDEGLS